MILWCVEHNNGDGSVHLKWFDNEEFYLAYLDNYEEYESEPFCDAGHRIDTESDFFKKKLNPVYGSE